MPPETSPHVSVAASAQKLRLDSSSGKAPCKWWNDKRLGDVHVQAQVRVLRHQTTASVRRRRARTWPEDPDIPPYTPLAKPRRRSI